MNSIKNSWIAELSEARTAVEGTRFVLDDILSEIENREKETFLQKQSVRKPSITIHEALSSLSPPLANSYAQITKDLDDDTRISWAGTAHEIREVLATMLRLLAPDDSVIGMSWYLQDKNTSGPTQAQRVRYILQQRGAGSREMKVSEKVISLDGMIENLVRDTYSRASDAAHRFKEREEVKRIFRYFEAFASDLLNVN